MINKGKKVEILSLSRGWPVDVKNQSTKLEKVYFKSCYKVKGGKTAEWG